MRFIAALLLLCVSLCFCIEEGMAQPRPFQKLQQKRKESRADRLVEEGLTLLQNGKRGPAKEKFEEALRLDPRNARAHAQLGWLAWLEQRYAAAQSHAEAALRIQPDNPRAHLVLAHVLMRNDKDLAAFDHLQKAARVGKGADQAEAARELSSLRARHGNSFRAASSPPDNTLPPPSAVMPNANAAPPGARPLLAVFAFSDAQLDSSENKLGEMLSEMFATSLINRGAYRVIERSQLERVLQEQALGQSGALEAETTVMVGTLLGAQAVVVGSLYRPASVYEADARILSVSTGEALAASHARAPSSAQLRDLAETLAQDLSAKAGMVPISAKEDSAAKPAQ